MKVVTKVETLYCDICRTDKNPKTFNFDYLEHDGDRLQTMLQIVHLCTRCQERVLKFIALESGGALEWRPADGR